MAKVKGYYNINNSTFLGPMTATNEATKVASTPRYVEGVCFGEYDTETDEFVPHTNPMHIPKGMIYEQDEVLDPSTGTSTIHRSGIEEEKGLDIVSRGLPKGLILNRTPAVETRDEKGKVYPDRPNVVQKPPEVKPKPIQSKVSKVAKPKIFKSTELPKDVDFDNLF